MKLNRFFKIIFLSEFVKALLIAFKEIFKKKKTINYPFEKGKISPRFRGEHAIEQAELMIKESKISQEELIFLKRKISNSRQDLEILYLMKIQ